MSRFTRRSGRVVCAGGICLGIGITAIPAAAQHIHPAAAPDTMRRDPPSDALAHAASRMGSGTTWVPDATPMCGVMRTVGRWRLMLDGTAALQYVRQSGLRRQWQIGSTNWAMGMADHELAGGTLQLRAMLSAEPATLTAMGYPLLLQTAEPYRGGTLTDRQHPHELLSEIAIRYTRPITRGVAAEVYLAPAGEPAIGPVAYRHRPSATNDPATPLGHHTQDGTHTTFGVATVGLFTSVMKLDASVFNGRHPDERRTNLELGSARLDSWAGRFTVNPFASLSLSGSFAYIGGADDGPHAGHGSLHRVGASVLHVRTFQSGGALSSAIIYGADLRGREAASLPSLLLETNAEMGRTSIFGRIERVRRSAGDLALTGSVSSELTVRALSLGAARVVGTLGALALDVAVRGTANFLPRELEPFYGSRTPFGLFAYGYIRPRTMMVSHGAMEMQQGKPASRTAKRR